MESESSGVQGGATRFRGVFIIRGPSGLSRNGRKDGGGIMARTGYLVGMSVVTGVGMEVISVVGGGTDGADTMAVTGGTEVGGMEDGEEGVGQGTPWGVDSTSSSSVEEDPWTMV